MRVLSTLWLVVGGILAFALAWINGANNAGNSIGSAVGAGVLSVKRALWLAAVFEFMGAVIFGNYVSITLMRGIVEPSAVSSPDQIVAGMCAALLSTTIWAFLATLVRVPVSIAQAIVGGVLGFGLVVAGVDEVNWLIVLEIAASWLYLPFVSMALAIALYRLYSWIMGRASYKGAVASAALFIAAVVYTAALLLVIKPDAQNTMQALTLPLAPALVSAAVSTAYIQLRVLKRARDVSDLRSSVSRMLLIASCAAMAFSHGANNVANAAGPLAGIMYVEEHGRVPEEALAVPLSAIMLSALGIAVGIVMWGYSVVETIGERITALTTETAFTAQFAAAIATLVVTRMGLPAPTTIAVVGAIAGVGLARGVRSVNFRTLLRILFMWSVGFPVVTLMSALLTAVLVRATF